MSEPGFQPFEMPAPMHGRLGVQVQFEQFVLPTDPGEMLRQVNSGRVRVILTGDGEAMRPYMDAIGLLWEQEPQ
jgi:hypothetical protein